MLTWINSSKTMNSSLLWFPVTLPWNGSALWQKKRWKKHTWTINRSHESPSGPYRGCQPRGQLFLCWEHQQCAFHGETFQALEIFHSKQFSFSLNRFLFTVLSSHVKPISSGSLSLQEYLIKKEGKNFS